MIKTEQKGLGKREEQDLPLEGRAMGDSKTDKRNDKVFRPPRNRAIRSLNDLYVLAVLRSYVPGTA